MFNKGELCEYRITIIDSCSIIEERKVVGFILYGGKISIKGIDATSLFFNEPPKNAINEEQFNRELENKLKYFKLK